MESPLTRPQLTRYVRTRLASHLFDESGVEPLGTAIYGLSDPRDIRDLRYVGQTRSPRSRYLQHLSTARLWMPDETPWWIREIRLRPLYDWIRMLYQDGQRLPVMVVSAWIEKPADVLSAERARIMECLGGRMNLLNIESERTGMQVPLL